jgi:hypothetical protein
VSAHARRLPLRGADLVLVAMQALWRREKISNNTLMVVECDGPLDPARIRRALDGFLEICPWPVARLRRPFPWGKLHWAADRHAVPGALSPLHQRVDSPTLLHTMLEAELNAAIDPRREPPLRVSILDSSGGRDGVRTFLVFTWFHPLMDPRGAQNLLAHLAHIDQADGRAPWNGAPPAFVPEPDPRPLSVRGRMGRRSRAYMRALAPTPPASPGSGVTTPGRARFVQASFVHRDPVGARAKREICWRLALVGKAMSELWSRRGLPDEPFLLPISVDLRPKGDPGPTFGNMLAFHFARFRPSETADLTGLTLTLRRQMVEALRDGQIDANAAAMEFLTYRPLSVMLNDLPGTAARETFSFNCADLGDFPGSLEKLFGARVVNAYHAPSVLPRPGIGVFFNRWGKGNNLVVSWIDGAVSEDEVTRIVEVIRAEMDWIEAR